MREIETKLRCNDEELLRKKLLELGAKPTQTYKIVDVYYGKPGETMKTAENLLRIRTRNGIGEITFKGKVKAEKNIWERTEINVPIGDAEKMELILKNLGFVIILRNQTFREYWDVEGTELGIIKIVKPAQVNFVEIEGKSRGDVERTIRLFGGILESIGKDHFKNLDEANGSKYRFTIEAVEPLGELSD